MKQVSIHPSLLAEAARCERRAWLSAHNISIAPVRDRPNKQKQHLPMQQGDWIYEVRLSSGARLDGWHRAERVAVEYKTEQPHFAHVLQGWAYAGELKAMGLENAEMQLWYPQEWNKSVEVLAGSMGLPCRLLEEIEMAAIWLNTPDVDAGETVEKSVQRIKKIAKKTVPHAPKPRTTPVCSRCPYYDFCHL